MPHKNGRDEKEHDLTPSEAVAGKVFDDLREAQLKSGLTREEFSNELIKEHYLKTRQDRFEMGEDFLGIYPRKDLKNIRDIDVDGLGKKKTGRDMLFFKK